MATQAGSAGLVRRQLPLVAWLGTLTVAIVVLAALGGGQLATPPLTSPGEWSGWLSAREPVVAAVAILRLLVLGVAWYLVGVTTVSLVAHVARAAALVRIADALSVPIVRRVVRHAVGAAMAGAVLTSTVGPGLAASPPLAAGADVRVAADSDGLTMQAFDDDPTLLAMTHDDGGGAAIAMSAIDDVAAEPAAAEMVHEVVAGDHLWSISERALAAAWDRQPSDEEVASYWRAVIAANRAVLVDPGDPDLLYPGQVVTLPTPTAPPGTGGGTGAST